MDGKLFIGSLVISHDHDNSLVIYLFVLFYKTVSNIVIFVLN